VCTLRQTRIPLVLFLITSYMFIKLYGFQIPLHEATLPRRGTRVGVPFRGYAPASPRSLTVKAFALEPAFYSCEVQDIPGKGKGLVASADIDVGEDILTVPLSCALSSSASSTPAVSLALAPVLASLPPQYLIALHLLDLQDRLLCGERGLSRYRWILETLPASFLLPSLCGDNNNALPAAYPGLRDFKRDHERASALLSAHWSPDRVAWAASQAWSRCFKHPGTGELLLVPYLDFANHATDPNAAVEFLANSLHSQGLAALAEVAEVAAAAPAGEPLAVLRATRPIAPGEEVTISYGSGADKRPEDFMLRYGFNPQQKG
jgi:hypothetical protein